MEVGEQPVDDPEPEAGMDEKRGFALPFSRQGLRFQRPQRRGAHGEHAPAGDRLQRLVRERRSVPRACGGPRCFRVAHRLEGARADVQGDCCNACSFALNLLEYFLVKVQAGGRRRDRARPLGVHGLVALRILGAGRVRDVGRQRHAAAALEQRRDRLGEAHADQVRLAPEHLDRNAVAHREPVARLERMARVRERERLALAGDPLDEQLDAAARALVAAQARLDDPGVVQHQRIARVDQGRQVGEGEVAQRAARAVQVQQAAGGARLRGMLGNELGRKFIVEIREPHCCRIIESQPWPEWRNW